MDGANPVALTGELIVTRGDNGNSTEVGVTVTVSDDTPIRVPGDYPTIQAAIEAADPGALILVAPGSYDENVIMWKPVRLQGAGAGSTTINGVKRPTDRIVEWRVKMDCLFGIGAGCTQVVDALPNQLVGAAGFDTDEGAAITVVAPADNSFGAAESRIDGFSITGGDTGGGIFVNGYAHNLEISNNHVYGNNGSYHGGIRVGRPFLELDIAGPYAFNEGVNIHHNSITQNGGLDGAGGGVSLMAGTDGYNVSENFVCGNFTIGDGAGIGHLGLSDGGVIANNRILFNQSFDQAQTRSGGGVFIGGEVPVAGELTAGSGSVVVDANLIQGNQAGAGHGGGIRTQYVNGQDIPNTNNNAGNNRPGQWNRIDITNNMIVNNVAGWSGAGISMQDTARSFVINNTVAHNDSTATVAATFTTGDPNISAAQPAGISSEPHSPGLVAVITNNRWQDYSSPVLQNNIVWQNRSSHYEVTGGAAGLMPSLSGDCTGDYWDLGVLGDSGFSLRPQNSVLTDSSGYANSNVSSDPNLLSDYCNGSRELLGAPGPMLAIPALDEGGAAWIDVRYGPLVSGGDYHIGEGSSAIGRGVVDATDHDFDNEPRPAGTAIDSGADEVDFDAPVAGASITPLSLQFGNVAPGEFANLNLTLQNDGLDALTGITVGAFPEGFSEVGLNGNCGVTAAAGLAPGDSCRIRVRFSPTDETDYSGTVEITADTAITNSTVPLSGTGFLAPIASVSPGALAFGDVLTGSTVTLDLTLSNLGNADLTGVIVGDTFTAGLTQTTNCAGTVLPGASCTITVEFAPTSIGLVSGDVTVTADTTANGTVTDVTVPVSGIGIQEPIATISPAPLAFGDVSTGTVATDVLTLSNTGNAALEGISVSGFAGVFTQQASTCGTSLAAGADCTITVQFAPDEEIEYSGDTGAEISVTASNVAAVTNSPVTVSGSGVAPQGTAEFAGAAPFSLAGAVLDFGTLPNGNYSSTVSINALTNPVTFGQLTRSGAGRFQIGVDTCSNQTVPPGGQCSVEITFNANGNNAREGLLTVPHNGTGGPLELQLLGQ